MSRRSYPTAPIILVRRSRPSPEQYDYESPFVTYSAPPRRPIFVDDVVDPRRPSPPFRTFIDPRMTGHFTEKPAYHEVVADPRRGPRNIRPYRMVSRLPFGRAMRKLFLQVDKAEEFYQEFQNDFERDISDIKSYATHSILAELWLLKTGRVSRDRRNSDSAEIDDKDKSSSPARISEKFDEWQEKVSLAMQAATNARLGDISSPNRKIENRLESKRRLQRKVEVSSEQVVDLLQRASEDREDCKALLEELVALKALINPADEKNSEVYKGVGPDELDDDDNE